MGWIRIRMDPELLPGSGSGTQKIQSWIRISNESFWIHNTAFNLAGKLYKLFFFFFLPLNEQAKTVL